MYPYSRQFSRTSLAASECENRLQGGASGAQNYDDGNIKILPSELLRPPQLFSFNIAIKDSFDRTATGHC